MSSPLSAVEESPAAAASRRRREKLLAKADTRMKLVSGEKVDLNAGDTTPSKPALETEPAKEKQDLTSPAQSQATNGDQPTSATPATPVDTRPKWERKWEQNVAAVTEKREVPQDLLQKLDVTASMAVEAPRAAAAAADKPKNVPVMSNSSRIPFGKMRLDSVLTSLTAIFLGYMSGVSHGSFILENIWLPFGSFLLFALLFRVIISTSLRKMNLLKPQAVASSGGMLSTALKFLPPPISSMISSLSTASGFFKDSYDDMMLFIFAHGLASTIVTAQLQAAAAMKAASGGMVEEEQEFVSLN